MWHQLLEGASHRLRGTALEPVMPDHQGRFPVETAVAVAAAAVIAVGVAGFLAPSPRQPEVNRWYARLKKPSATPPKPVFTLIWPALEIALGYAGYRLLRRPSSVWRNRALSILAVNLSAIPTFSRVFFGHKDLQSAEVNTLAQALGAWSFVATAWHADRGAAIAAAPHAVWTTFATWLIGQVVRRNDPQAKRAHLQSGRSADKVEQRLRRAL